MDIKGFFNNMTKMGAGMIGGSDVVVDLGTSMTRIGIFDKGIVLREPTYVGKNSKTGEYLFFGAEAKDIYGKTPTFITVVKPVEHSIISDFDSTAELMSKFFQKSVYPYFLKNNFIKTKITAYTSVSSQATEVEQRALEEVLAKAGARNVYLIEKTVAAAYGASLPIFSNTPFFVIDCSAGLCEMAIIIMGGIVASKSIKIGGDHMDKLIYNYLHLKYGIIAGEPTCERLKIELFNLEGEKKVMTVRGKSLENGLPKSVRVSNTDIREALVVSLNQIIDAAKELLETVPPEIIDGVIKNGVVLTGGLANIEGIGKYISQEIKIPVMISETPQDATIRGLLALLKDKPRLEKLVIK